MHCPLPSLESPWSGVKMGKQGGSVEQEEPQVSPERNVSRLTWSRIIQQIAKETLRFSSQPLPASGQCHGPATAPTASPGTNSRISWVLRIDIRTRVAEVVRGHRGPPPKKLDSDENFKLEHTLFCCELRFVAIYALFGDLWAKKVPLFISFQWTKYDENRLLNTKLFKKETILLAISNDNKMLYFSCVRILPWV